MDPKPHAAVFGHVAHERKPHNVCGFTQFVQRSVERVPGLVAPEARNPDDRTASQRRRLS
jgi:hypothetical protein